MVFIVVSVEFIVVNAVLRGVSNTSMSPDVVVSGKMRWSRVASISYLGSHLPGSTTRSY